MGNKGALHQLLGKLNLSDGTKRWIDTSQVFVAARKAWATKKPCSVDNKGALQRGLLRSFASVALEAQSE